LNRVVGDAAPRIAVVVVIAIRMTGIRGIGPVAAIVAAIIPMVMPFTDADVDTWCVDIEALRLG
jgi:hypothetical protein